MDQAWMSSGEVARAAGVNVETLRFYERRGLLPKPGRTVSGHRRYGAVTLERIQLIKRAQALGFSLPEIATLLEAMNDPQANCEEVCATVQVKLDHMDQLLVKLRAQRRRLLQLRDACPQVRPLRECPVIEELVRKPLSGRRLSR